MKNKLQFVSFVFGIILAVSFFAPANLFSQNQHNHGLAKPEANTQLEIIPDRNNESKIVGQKRIDVNSGIPKMVYSPNFRVSGSDPETMARQYLEANAADLLQQRSTSNLQFQNVIETPGGYHVHFIQTENGYPVYGSDLNVTISKNNEVVFFANGYQKTGEVNTELRTSAASAIDLGKQYLSIRGKTSFEKVETVVYKIDEKNSVLAHKVNIVPAENNYGDWEILVDAGSGKILRVEDKACYFMPEGDTVTGSGVVFDPDPVTAAATLYGSTGFLDNSDADHDSLTRRLDTVALNNITWNGSDYLLIGPYAEIIDHESPYTGLYGQATKVFEYNRSNEAFEATNIYYHVDKSMRYINETLGFTVMPFQYSGGVRFDPHGLGGARNAHYTGSNGAIAFGSPSAYVDLGEDQAVIIHELGHALHAYITNGGLSQVNGLSEGLSDYWAQSYARSLGIYEPSDPQYNYFGVWGGQAWPNASLRVTNYTAHYPEGLVGQVHTDGQMWSSSLMTIYDSIGRTATDMDCWEAISMLNSSSSQRDAAMAFIAADGLLHGGDNLDVIAEVFFNRGYLLSSWALIADFTAETTAGEGPLEVQFTDLSVALETDFNSWEWDFDNDGQVDSYLQNPTHTFTEKGTYTVQLKVSNGINDSTITKNNYISVNGGILVFETTENAVNHSGVFIRDFLENNGFEVNYSNNFPSTFSGFDAVFLSMGNFIGGRTELSNDRASALQSYIESGGIVYLEGGDALGWDQRSNSTLRSLFGLNAVADGSTNVIDGLAGNTGALTDGISFSASTQVNNAYIDKFTPADPANVAFTESGYGTVAAQYSGATYGQKTFCFSYALSHLTDIDSLNSRATVMYRLLDFFELKPPPSDLLAYNITETSADLSWTENGTATAWEIRLGETGFDTTGVAPMALTANPYTAAGLTKDTDYDFFVRSDYGGDVYSEWIGPFTFTTLLGLPEQEMQKLLAGDGTAGAYLGKSVSISGDFAIVGASGDYNGSAYIYYNNAGTWEQQAKLTSSDGGSFGTSVSIEGDYAIVGATGTNTYQGSAYIFEKPVGGWVNMTETAKLTASDGVALDNFGSSVSISGNVVVVGKNNAFNASLGTAYVFEKPAGGWVNTTETAKLTASDGANGDQFGRSVSISDKTLLVGGGYGINTSQGAAYVFKKPAGGWISMTETAKITASDGGEYFGSSVNLSGKTAIVGAHGDNSFQGSAYVFEEPAGGWVNMTETAKLSASDGEGGDEFGGSVSISGHYIIVGAWADDNPDINSGSAYAFEKPDGGWVNMTETAKLSASDGDVTNNFGSSVSISGNYAVIGAPGFNSTQGAAYIFEPATCAELVTNITKGTSYCTIQDAIDDASFKDVIVVGDGVYTENIVIDKSLTLRSENGKDFTTIQGIDDGLATVYISNSVNAVNFGDYGQGFHVIGIDQSNPGIETAAIYLGGAHDTINIIGNNIEADGDHGLLSNYNAAIQRIKIDSNMFTGKTFRGTEPAGSGFSQQFTLWNVPRQLVTMGGGENPTNSYSIWFTNNTITGVAGGLNSSAEEQGNTLVTIDVLFAQISGNTFDGTTTRFGSSLRVRGSYTDIYNNTFNSGGLGLGCNHIFMGDGSAISGAYNSPTLAAVANNNVYDKAAYVSDPLGVWYVFHTLQAPIYAAPADGTVTALAGTFVEAGQIPITKNLTILGAGKASTFIMTDQNTGTSGDSRGWWLVSDGVELNLSDLTLDGTGYLVYQAIRTRGSGTIDNVRFTEIKFNESGPDYLGVGVAAFGNGNVDITNCMFDEIGRVGVLYFGAGITASNFLSNNYTGKGDGDWLDYGVEVGAGATVLVNGSTFSNCTGIASADGSTSGGVLVSTFFGPGTDATISDNLFDDNTTGVIVGSDPSDASVANVNENNFVGNDFGVTSSAPLVDAKFNYWGAADGPTHASNECGTGDAVSDNVTFAPYYEDEIRSTLRESCNADPVAYWPLDEGTGTFAEDVTDNTNDGTIMGGEEWITGVDGGGLNFDGVDNKIDAGNDASIDMGTGDFSIAAWIKMDPTQNTFPTLLAKGAGNNTDNGYWFLVKNNRLRLYISDGTSRLKAESNAAVAYDNLWHHVAAVVDRDDMVTFYVDGFAAGTFNVSSFDGKDITSARNLTIGSWFNYSYTYLNACMDDIRLYDVALDAEEVEMLAGTFGVNNPPVIDVEATATPAVVLLPATTQLVVVASDLDEGDILTYSWSKLSGVGEVTFTPNNDPSASTCTASFSAEGEYVLRVSVSDGTDFVTSDVDVLVITDGTEPPAPVAHWPMDENTGTTTEDVTLNTNDGTLLNGTAWTAGIDGSALMFDGINDRVDCGTGAELNMGSGDFTISSWVNLGTQYTTFPTLVANGAGNTTDAGYWLMLANSKLRLYISNGTTRLKAESSAVSITDNAWYHLAVVVDRDGNITFYVDGVLAGTVDVSSLDGANITNSRSLTIGSWSNYSYTLIEGKMDETKLFNVALDATQVGDLFNEFATFKKAMANEVTTTLDEVTTYPNPFTSSTTLAFNLGSDQHVNISVFDLHGNRVAVLKDEKMLMGRQSITWDGNDGATQVLPAGMYIVRIIGETNVEQKTIMKLK